MIALLLVIASIVFWSAFNQSATSVNFFVHDLIDRSILGFNIPTAWFYALNSLFIILFAPILGWIWISLANKNKEPSSVGKFSIALFLGTLSFIILYLASQALIANNGTPISPLWIVGFYFVLTIAELCLSPVGLSSMTRLAPNKMQGQMMGLWCTSMAIGGMVAGLIGGHVSVENIHNLPNIFLQCTLSLFIGAVILFMLRKPLAKLIN